MSVAAQPMFLSDEVFELLVRRVPAEVLREVPAERFVQMIGVERARFQEIVTALGDGGRTQGLIGEETAGYLRNALGVAVLECGPEEFRDRTGTEREDAVNLFRHLNARLDAASREVA